VRDATRADGAVPRSRGGPAETTQPFVELKDLTVRQLMTDAPQSVTDMDGVVLVARRMRALGLTAVPVCSVQGEFLGMLSDRDIIERCVADCQDPRVVSAGSLLSGPQPVIEPSLMADATVLALILAQPSAELPVVEKGRLIGVLTIADIAASLIDDEAADDAYDLWRPDSADPT